MSSDSSVEPSWCASDADCSDPASTASIPHARTSHARRRRIARLTNTCSTYGHCVRLDLPECDANNPCPAGEECYMHSSQSSSTSSSSSEASGRPACRRLITAVPLTTARQDGTVRTTVVNPRRKPAPLPPFLPEHSVFGNWRSSLPLPRSPMKYSRPLILASSLLLSILLMTKATEVALAGTTSVKIMESDWQKGLGYSQGLGDQIKCPGRAQIKCPVHSQRGSAARRKTPPESGGGTPSLFLPSSPSRARISGTFPSLSTCSVCLPWVIIPLSYFIRRFEGLVASVRNWVIGPSTTAVRTCRSHCGHPRPPPLSIG